MLEALEHMAVAAVRSLSESFPEDLDVVEEVFAGLHETVSKRAGLRQQKAAAAWEVEEHVGRIAISMTTEPGPHYYYIPSTTSFVRCDDTTYTPATEDDVLADVLLRLRSEPSLSRTKHKHKQSIMKLIRDNTLLGSIPSSRCIQNVLGLMRTVLVPSKLEAKLLLTALGDGILRKSGSLHYVLPPAAAPALEAFAEVATSRLGPRHAPTAHFQHYYEPGEAARARAFRTHSGYSLGHVLFDQHALNIAVVAAHYSRQHGSASQLADRTLVSHAAAQEAWLSPSRTVPVQLVEGFAARALVKSPGCSLSRKHIQFLWRVDGQENGRLLRLEAREVEEMLPFDIDATRGLLDCSSPAVAKIDQVISFCRKFVLHDPAEHLMELSELHRLYSDQERNDAASEEMFCSILEHFSSDAGLPAIENGAVTIDGVRCTLWDKRGEVLAFFGTEVGAPAYGLRTAAAYRRYVEWKAPSASPALRASRAYFWRLADELGTSS